MRETKLLHGDRLELLKTLPDCSVDIDLFITKQETLGAEFEQVLSDNIWVLYQS